MVKLLSVGGAKKTSKIENFGLKVCLVCIVLSCGIARFLSLRPASKSVRVGLRSCRSLPRGSCGLPQGPIAGCLKVRAGCLEVRAGCLEVRSRVALRFVWVASRSHVWVASRSQGTNFETKIFNFRWVFGPSDRNELYFSPLLSKINRLKIVFGRIPLTLSAPLCLAKLV